MPEGTTTPLDELAGFLSGNSAASLSPQNPLNQNADPSANPSNPNMNKDMPGAWANPSNPELNPHLPNAVTNPSNPKYNPSMPGATNNPSNYQYNPTMPGSMTNPSNPQLNPNYPGSLMNPANPIHNPDYPVHQEIERPPGLSENASLPPAHASWHESGLWWEPGQFGRGLMSPEGELHTWPEDEMTHTQRLRSLGVEGPAQEQWSRYSITPNGAVGVFTPDEGASLTAVDSRLRPKVSPYAWNPQTQKAERNPNYTAAWHTADNYTQDSREWPDPTEPRASEPPAPHGCTCRNGTDSVAKLYCPIHGLDGQWEEARDWSIPENHPVGYPEDQPRGWTDAVHSKTLEGHAMLETQMHGPWDGMHDPERVQKHTNQEGNDNPDHNDDASIDQRHGGNLPVKRPTVKYPKFITTREQHERGKRRWSLTPKKPKQSAMDPRHIEEYQRTSLNGPYLYHATTPDAAEAILREGLYPHDAIPGSGAGLVCNNCNYRPDESESMYLDADSDCPNCGDDYLRHDTPSQYAGQYYEPRSGHTYMGDFGMVRRDGYIGPRKRLLRIDMRKLDPQLINPDEDAFNPGAYSPEHYPIVKSVIGEDDENWPPNPEMFGDHQMSFGDWADRAHLGQDPEETKHSLFAHGSVAYNGVVPPEAIEEANPENGMALNQPAAPESSDAHYNEAVGLPAMAKVQWQPA